MSSLEQIRAVKSNIAKSIQDLSARLDILDNLENLETSEIIISQEEYLMEDGEIPENSIDEDPGSDGSEEMSENLISKILFKKKIILR